MPPPPASNAGAAEHAQHIFRSTTRTAAAAAAASAASDGLPALPLPAGVRADYIDGVNGVRMHILTAGCSEAPLLLLLHGFPEISFSWRHVLVPLASAGYHCVAPDLRGYGRTCIASGQRCEFDSDLGEFCELNRVSDMVCLVHALGHTRCATVVGHDFGSSRAFWCALTRPDLFCSLVCMSAPCVSPPLPVVGQHNGGDTSAGWGGIGRDLLQLGRLHYQEYYCSSEANAQLLSMDLRHFFRAYYHMKSADWEANQEAVTSPPAAWSAQELAKLPEYYVMRYGKSMAETVAAHMPSPAFVVKHSSSWLADADVEVYANEYGRTGFQGGLNDYRVASGGLSWPKTKAFAGASLKVQSCFIAGNRDVGVVQRPGTLRAMESAPGYVRTFMVEGAGHWVQQEQPMKVVQCVLEFLDQSQAVAVTLPDDRGHPVTGASL